MTTIHAHVETSATDCDGPLYQSYIMQANEGEDEYGFKSRILMALVSWSYDNRVVFDSGEDDGFDWDSITVDYDHDEGHFHGEARTCRNEDCDPDARTQRDVYAEMMGY
jgi:hypothetical protein